MHASKPALIAAATIVLAGALVAGCGGGDDDRPATSSPTTPTASGAPASASASATPSASLPPGATPLPTVKAAKLAGATLASTVTAANTRDKSVKVAVAATGPLSITAEGAGQSSSKRKVSATLTGGKKLAVVRSGDTAYLQTPGAPTWYKIDANGSEGLSSTYNSSFVGYEVPANLAATATALKKLGTFTVVGAQTVTGIATTRYTVRTTATKASALLPPAYQPVNPTRLKQGKATVSVWVDAQGRLVRTSTVATVPSIKKITVQVTYSGWGATVDVAPPPAGDVTTF